MESSSLIDLLAVHVDRAEVPLRARRRANLVEALMLVPDRRDPRGVVHALAGVLAVAVAAVLTGGLSCADARADLVFELPRRLQVGGSERCFVR